MTHDELPDFADPASLISAHARVAPEQPALVCAQQTLSYAQLDACMDAAATAWARDGFGPGHTVAIVAPMGLDSAVAFLGALRAGLAVAPLAPGQPVDVLARMLRDSNARRVLASYDVQQAFSAAPRAVTQGLPPFVSLPDSASLLAHAADAKVVVTPTIDPSWPFNLIYSSGTTGEPKGIVQPHAMRWAYARRAHRFGYGASTVTLVSTPLYSNTTLVVYFPTLAFGGTVVLMPKFDAREWLELAQRHRVTHAMLVPVQYQRLLAHPEFDRFDLSSFRYKFATSAPFPAALKAQAIGRWPGELVEFYGSTEGGGSCLLEASQHPDKLHTVGRPAPGHDLRLINEAGRELPRGDVDAVGEVVGRSSSMMTGYHGKPEATREVEWFDAQGQRFLRSGDIGRFDADGFLTLIDRRKDVIISGGFNVYPSDLEAVLRQHPAVAEVAVVGVPSERWGETPVAHVVLHGNADARQSSPEAMMAWAHERLGRTQRLHDLRVMQALPRNAIGKVLKRELRDAYGPA